MNGYIIVNPFASDEERRVATAINHSGGVGRATSKSYIFGGVAAVLWLGLILVPYPLISLLMLGVALASGWLTYRWYVKPLKVLKQRIFITTCNDELIELDSEWLKLVELTEERWRASEDQRRYATLRPLAELAYNEAKEPIAQELATVRAQIQELQHNPPAS